MKRFLIKFLLCALFASPLIYLACNKKSLDRPSPTQSEGTYFANEAQFRTAILGVYATLTDYYSSSNAGGGFGSAELQAWFLPGDDLSIGNGNSFEIFKGLTGSNGSLNQVWKSSYIMIGRANKVIERATNVPATVFTTPDLKNAITGEALFLRAYAHFHLWNLFGTAPVDTIVPVSTDEFNIPSSTGTQLLDQAISDLTQASALLPSSWPANDLGRVTANSAHGMLGKVLVFRASANKSAADYQAAITEFNKITGVSLTANFGDNFDLTKENNPESLFEFQGGPNIKNEGQNSWLANDICDCGVAGSYFQMFSDGAGGYMGGGQYAATTKIQNSFNPADPRLPYTLTGDKMNFVKYVRDGGSTDGAVISRNNHRILRYADVLLLKAEAVLQSSGSTAEAISLINEVRARARAAAVEPADLSTAETNKTTIMQWIMDERFRELAGEGHRWFDLRRWHMAGYITLNNAFFDSVAPGDMDFKVTNILFPIPTNETDVNPNVIQNPGY
ncbi:MAG: RagB/SusD family nutrient uptake outer membrane protein [Chitinophagaceae bacterium]